PYERDGRQARRGVGGVGTRVVRVDRCGHTGWRTGNSDAPSPLTSASTRPSSRGEREVAGAMMSERNILPGRLGQMTSTSLLLPRSQEVARGQVFESLRARFSRQIFAPRAC